MMFLLYTGDMVYILTLISQHLPWFWFAVVVLCTIIEFFTFGLTTVWFGIGGIVMVFLSFLPIPFIWQMLIFLLLSTTLLIFTRPLVVKKLHVGKTKTNADSLIGRRALVIQKITRFDSGEAKINGTVWTARSADGSEIMPGTECVIERIEGVTLYVTALPDAFVSPEKM